MSNPVRLSDSRPLRVISVEQADELFANIAMLTVQINKVKAAYEKRIADLKAAYDEQTAGPKKLLEEAEKMLKDYILANPYRFIKPRQRQTEYGKYGLRTVANLEIINEEDVKAACAAQGIDAVIYIERLDKKALEKALADGAAIPGCEIRSGEVASYTVTKSLLEDFK